MTVAAEASPQARERTPSGQRDPSNWLLPGFETAAGPTQPDEGAEPAKPLGSWLPFEEAPAEPAIGAQAPLINQDPDLRASEPRADGATADWLPAAVEARPEGREWTTPEQRDASNWLPSSEAETAFPAPAEQLEPATPLGSWLPAEDASAEPDTAREDETSLERSTEPITPAPVGVAPEAPTFAPSQPQTQAVDAYTRELCPREAAPAAARETLESFAGGDDTQLLRHTRGVAAGYAAVAPARRGWRRVLATERDPICQMTPSLLAARANGGLEGARSKELELHLGSCLTCQAVERRTQRAEHAFAGITGIALTAGAVAAATAAAAEALAPEPPAAADQAPAPAEVTPADTAIAAGATSEWLPTGAEETDDAQTTPAAEPVAAGVGDTTKRPFSRRGLAGVIGGAVAVAAAAAVAVVLLTSGGSKHVTVASTPAVVTTSATPPPVRHKARPATKTHHRASKPATHHAASAAVASVTPASSATSSSSAPTASPSPPASSPPTSSPPPASPPPSNPAPAQPPVSIQQPSLGTTAAPQGLGNGR